MVAVDTVDTMDDPVTSTSPTTSGAGVVVQWDGEAMFVAVHREEAVRDQFAAIDRLADVMEWSMRPGDCPSGKCHPWQPYNPNGLVIAQDRSVKVQLDVVTHEALGNSATGRAGHGLWRSQSPVK